MPLQSRLFAWVCFGGRGAARCALALLWAMTAACGSPATPVPVAPIPSPIPLPALPIQLPDGVALVDEFNPIPGTPSFHIQLTFPGKPDEAAAFFHTEFARLGMTELEMPNPIQAKNQVVRLGADSQKVRVVIMIVKHPIKKGSDIDIRWEEPKT